MLFMMYLLYDVKSKYLKDHNILLPITIKNASKRDSARSWRKWRRDPISCPYRLVSVCRWLVCRSRLKLFCSFKVVYSSFYYWLWLVFYYYWWKINMSSVKDILISLGFEEFVESFEGKFNLNIFFATKNRGVRTVS